MPISTLPNRHGFHFDKLNELRDYKLAPVSANGFEPGIAFVAAAIDVFKVIASSDLQTGYAAGTAQWTVTVEAATTLTGTYRPIASAVIDGSKPSATEMACSGKQIEQVVPGAKYLRISHSKIGGVGPLTYGAFISPLA
jgi:hypothetical protein